MKAFQESNKLVSYGTAAGSQLALRQGQFIPYFQPIVTLSTGQLAGFEILARWRHPRHGLVSPDQFISLAEKQGWIDTLTLELLRKAFAAAADSIPEPLTLSVNISPVQLRTSNLPALIRKAAEGTGFSLARLVLEITESAFVQDGARTLAVLTQLKELGVMLALDGFGYSSLSHLMEYPFDVVKIDETFIANLTESKASHATMAKTIELAHLLDLVVVCEGVETVEQNHEVSALAGDFCQGFYLSRPITAKMVGDLCGECAPAWVITDHPRGRSLLDTA